MASDARDNAVQQLNEALMKWQDTGDRYRAAMGTSSEYTAHGRVLAAGAEVTAAQAALKTIEGRGLGGRAWVNGREVGGAASIFRGLEDSHD